MHFFNDYIQHQPSTLGSRPSCNCHFTLSKVALRTVPCEFNSFILLVALSLSCSVFLLSTLTQDWYGKDAHKARYYLPLLRTQFLLKCMSWQKVENWLVFLYHCQTIDNSPIAKWLYSFSSMLYSMILLKPWKCGMYLHIAMCISLWVSGALRDIKLILDDKAKYWIKVSFVVT